jgi:hypothetical protein
MTGRLSVVSELSVGSTFTLHLNIAKGEEIEMASEVHGLPSSSQL